MRARLAKLAVLTGATALAVTGALGAAPTANAAPPQGMGTVTVTVVDDLGQPVKSLVVLVDAAGDEYDLNLPTPAGSVHTDDVPEGDYAVVALGGWNGITCAGTTTCELGLSGPSDLPEFQSAVLHVQNGTPATHTLTTQTPTLTGVGKVGKSLEIAVPDALGGTLAGLYSGLSGLYGDTALPGVTWMRDGQRIVGAGDTVYTPTKDDAGAVLTAKVTYAALYRLMFASLAPGTDISPAPATVGPIAVTKNVSTTSVEVVGKPKAGTPTTAWINVSGAASQITGWVEVRATGVTPTRVRIRDGFAQVKLPLRAGKRTVTATYVGNGALTSSKDTTTVRVKKAPHKRR